VKTASAPADGLHPLFRSRRVVLRARRGIRAADAARGNAPCRRRRRGKKAEFVVLAITLLLVVTLALVYAKFWRPVESSPSPQMQDPLQQIPPG